MSAFKAAVAQYPVSAPTSWEVFARALGEWVAEAAGLGAKLLVFPEYAAMSLAALFEPAVRAGADTVSCQRKRAREAPVRPAPAPRLALPGSDSMSLPGSQTPLRSGTVSRADLVKQLVSMQTLRDRYVELHAQLAERHGVYLLAGSFPWQIDAQRYVNRAWLFSPAADCGFQDKQVMTRFEREHWGISAGEPLKVFETALGCIGVAICYDSEFPLLVRAQVEAGANLLLVPSCTDALAGYHRVRVAAQARALESQCHVLLSPLVGEAAWSPAVDVNVGAAGVYGPPDLGFPADGVIAQGVIGDARWIYADIDTALTANVRAQGQVLNHRHWPEQVAAAAAVRVRL